MDTVENLHSCGRSEQGEESIDEQTEKTVWQQSSSQYKVPTSS